MSTSEWPMFLDIGKEDCKRILRRLELEAYSSLISAFRAQGDLTKDKKKVLQELCTILGISTERHRAEVRRAVNCERLATVADVVSGCSDYSEWAIEGRRLVPLMPRLVPQTAFTNIANANSTIAAHQNSRLPPPSATSNVKENLPTIPSNNLGAVVKVPAKPAVTDDYMQTIPPPPPVVTNQVAPSNDVVVSQQEVVVSTSPEVHAENDDDVVVESSVRSNVEERPLKRPRTPSHDSSGDVPQFMVKTSTPVPTTVSTNEASSSSTASSSRSMNIPIESVPLKMTLAGASGSASPLLTATESSSSTSTSSSIYPAKKVFLVSSSGANLSSSILQRSLTVPVMKAVGSSNSVATVSSQSQSASSSSSLITPISSSTPVSLVLSTSPATLSMSPSTGCTSLKIVAQTVPVSAAAKLGSKVTLGSAMPPIVVVTKTPIGKGQSASTRLVNMIGTQSSTGKRGGPSFVALGQKNKQTALIKVPPGMSFTTTAGKPNVYVVQKSQMMQQLKQSQPGSAFTISAASFSNAQTMLRASFGKVCVSSKEGFRLPAVSVPKARFPSPTVTTTTIATSGIGNQSGATSSKKSSVLADLLQATGILPESGTGSGALDATDQTMVLTGDDGKVVDRLVDERAVDISSFVEQLQCKELHQSSSDDRSPETAKNEMTHESGLLDPETGRFTNCPIDSIEGTIGHSSGVEDRKRIGSMTLADLIQSSIGDASMGDKSSASVEGMTLQRTTASKESAMADSTETTTTTTIEPQSTKAYLYKGGTATIRGMTYSKGDVAIHRKKVNECLLSGTSVGGEEEATLKCAVEPVAGVVQTHGVVAAMSSVEQQFHFVDDDFVEETVVTTDDTSTTNTDVDLGMRRPEDEMQVDAAIDMEQFTTSNRATLLKEHLSRVVSHSASGSSVFMVSDSSLGSETGQLDAVQSGLQSPYIIQQDVDGGSETLEIIGSTEDFDSVESRVAALHGEGDFSDDCDQRHESSSTTTAGIASPPKKKKAAATDDLSWYRAATGLLQRVMKFRGPNRFKGERGAAHWFLHPVSAEDAPGYHKVVKRPMDFTTILKKLEKFAYKSIADFHEDMLLVKHNCELYNPVDHPARHDCDCVFAFYRQEYGKLLSKTLGIGSTQKKRAT